MDPQPSINKVLKALGFKMENQEKVTRAVFGVSTNKGLINGVGEDASASQILARYDELHGYITKDGYKVKNRAFFDKLTKKPINKPKIVYIININGEFVEHEEGTVETLEMQLAKKQIKERKGEKGKGDKKIEEEIEE